MSENKKNETVQDSVNNESKKVTSAEKSAKTEKAKVAKKDKKPNIFTKLIGLFKGSWRELSHVTWSSKKATTRNSILVVVALIIVGVIFGLFDMGFNKLLIFVMDLY